MIAGLPPELVHHQRQTDRRRHHRKRSIWTSSYVLVATELAMLLLSLCCWALDCKRLNVWGVTVLETFGINALLAYVLQGVAPLLPADDNMHALGAASLKMDAPALVPSVSIVAFLVIVWVPLEFMRRRRRIVKI